MEWTFAPALAVARDIRWGRTYESYSEDPALVASYAGRFIRGLQGHLGRDAVVACAKHWVGDGGTTEGVDQGDTVASEDDLIRIHMAPYLPALEGGVLTVMASFNSWNGKKCHGHRYLLTDVLKGRLGFSGFVDLPVGADIPLSYSTTPVAGPDGSTIYVQCLEGNGLLPVGSYTIVVEGTAITGSNASYGGNVVTTQAVLFFDDFESGNVCSWSDNVCNGCICP